jgi:hypothetical protein
MLGLGIQMEALDGEKLNVPVVSPIFEFEKMTGGVAQSPGRHSSQL